MNWQIVIALALLAPLAALTVAAWTTWTVYVWKVRDDVSPPGREFWFSWVIVHVLVMAGAGVWLLLADLEGES